MYIETGHNGVGSRWAHELKSGNKILLGAVHAAPVPGAPGKILCLGDGTALGHFLSLKQLTDRSSFPLKAAIVLQDFNQVPDQFTRNNPDFEFVTQSDFGSLDTLEKWLLSEDLSCYTSIYIAGYIPMVSELRKKLKARPENHAKIYVHGFWA